MKMGDILDALQSMYQVLDEMEGAGVSQVFIDAWKERIRQYRMSVGFKD